MEKFYAITFQAVKEGDPGSPEECTTAVVRCLSCGNTAEEAAMKLMEFLRGELAAQYYNHENRQKAIRLMMQNWRDRKGQRPQILQWGIIYPVGAPRDIIEVSDTKGDYLVRVSCELAVA